MEYKKNFSRSASAYKTQANLFKALAHPVRLQILDILTAEESCVCHLTAILDQRQPYVSQHLMKLRDTGFERDRRDGVIVYYRLAEPVIGETLEAMREQKRDKPPPGAPRSPVPGCACPRCHADERHQY